MELNLETLHKNVTGLHGEVKTWIEKRDAEIAKNGAANEATAKKLDEVGESLNAAKGELEAALKKIADDTAASLKDAGIRIDEIEKKNGRRGNVLAQEALEGSASHIAKTFITSDSFKSFRERKGNSRSTIPVLIKSFFPGANEAAIKAIQTDIITGFIQPQRIEQLPLVRRTLRIRDLFNVRKTTANSIEYVEVTGMAAAAGAVALSSLTQTGGTATATTAAAHGLSTGNLVRIAGANQAGYNGDQYITVTGATTFTFAVDSGTVSPATGTVTWLNLSNQAGGAAAVAEGGTKPETLLSFALRSATAKKIAHWTPASDEVLADDAQLQALIEDELLSGLAYKEEVDLLYGSGTGASLQGLMTHSRIQTYNWSDGETLPVPDTKIDAFRRAMTLAQIREFVPTGGVLNPQDWEDFELAKGSDGHYIWLNVQTGVGLRAFQMPIVVTSAMLVGDGLVGAFANGAQIWDREEATIEVSNSHASYFISNLLAIRAEERLMFPISRPEAFVSINFDAEPS